MIDNSCQAAPIAPPVPIHSSERTCILVLGMHRSGTSAMARVMNLLGADLASGLMPARPDNSSGYWESTELMGIHEDLLSCASSRWDDWRPLSISVESKVRQERILDRLSKWLEREFANSQFFLVKDPRICRFVPLWLDILQSLSCQPRVVIPVRHPFEVAESLFARDGIPFAKSCLLWLRHVLDAERATRHLPRVWVPYENLLNDWPAVATHIAEQLGFSWPTLPEEAALEVSKFLSVELRHHVRLPQELTLRSDVVEWVRRTYAVVTRVIADGPVASDWLELDQLRAEFDSACLAFGDLINAEREVSTVQALSDVTVVTRSEFDKRVVGLEDNLRTVVAQQRDEVSRVEGEIAGCSTRVEQLRARIDSHGTFADALYQETRRLGEVTRLISDSASEQERSSNGELALLRADLHVVKAGVQEMRLMSDAMRAQLEQFHRDLENVRVGSFGQRWRRLCAFVPKPLKRVLRFGCEVLSGLVTFRWLRILLRNFCLPFYRNTLLSTGLFDPQWYLEQNPDVAASNVDPLRHWLTFGVREGRDPNPEFDTDWYLERYPRVAKSGQNPLIHYLRRGSSPGIDPNPGFDGASYLSEHPEVAKARLNPLVHYLQHPPAQYCDDLEEPTVFEPLVTVVVPNFNHAEFLHRRLDSIYSQTYRNFRVILLDDCSSDGSRAILDAYRNRYPDITTCHYNETNSGGVFRQWRKAIQLASGSPLLWIAESDDYCDCDFLEKLVPFFRDESVVLACGSFQFVDQEGVPHSYTFRDHLLPHIDASKWSQDFVEVGHREVDSALAIKNTIPNVSGAVSRTPLPNLALLEDETWLNMKVCGDWVLYLHQLAGGKIAHCASTTNYFRLHSSNSSRKVHRDEIYYREHARVSEEAARLYRVSDRTLGLAREVTQQYYSAMVGGGDDFDRLFDAKRIAHAKACRRPTVIISVFSFMTGGGEIIPIRLANELKRRGCPVVVHCFDSRQEEPGVRAMLRGDIPVYRAHTGEEILKMLADVEPDVVNTHHKSIQGRFLELAQVQPKAFESARHVATMHGMFEMSEFYSDEYLDNVLPMYVENVDGWIYTADKNVKPFQDRGLVEHASFTKISNGMERPEVRSISRSDLGIEPEAFVLCEASRAIPDKGWREAIDAVTQARENCSRPIHLVLLGTGAVFDELSQQSLPPYIHLLGFTDDSCSYYAMSDMAILPSTFSGESFPMTLVEAMMVGKPVIATDVGEIGAMISSDSGIAGALIPIDKGKVSVDQLSEQILRFAQNAEDYEQACLMSCALARRFDIRDIAEQYLEIFANTTKRSAQKPHVAADRSTFPPLFEQTEQLRKMKLFDEDFYRQQYLDIAETLDPLAHYVFDGCREKRMPNEWFDFEYLRQSGLEIELKGANPLWFYGMYLKDKKQIKTRSDMHRWGHCPVCEQRRLFLAHFDTLDSFNNLRCIACHGAPRDRAVAMLLDQHLPGWRKTARVHESSPCTPCLKMLAGDYSSSQYYPEKRLGAMVDGFRNENIEKMTFGDNAFDVVAALEVIEHVFNPSDMVREMVRCTRPGGIAVFTTVPCGIPVSRPRAKLDSITGEIEHFFPPIYHGNPIGDGALLTWDFGLDFDDNIRMWGGGAELTHWCKADEQIGIIHGGIPHIYLLKKPVA